jgi:hypothetical protein
MDDIEGVRGSLLRVAWAEILATNAETVRNFPAAARAIDAGASAEDVVTAMQAASYETAFRLLFLLSSEHAPEDQPDAAKGWALVPFDLATGRPQIDDGEVLLGVHEDLMEADPTGRGGEDLWN